MVYCSQCPSNNPNRRVNEGPPFSFYRHSNKVTLAPQMGSAGVGPDLGLLLSVPGCCWFLKPPYPLVACGVGQSSHLVLNRSRDQG